MNGRCMKDRCTCVGVPRPVMGMRAFCQHWNAEQPPDKYHAESIRMWSSLSDDERTRCLNHLRSKIPPDILAKWRDQLARGMAIGSDNVRFHFEGGMSIRNILRGVMSDDELPWVKNKGGTRETNWDDFYYGALHGVVLGETGDSHPVEPKPAFWKFALWVISAGTIRIK